MGLIMGFQAFLMLFAIIALVALIIFTVMFAFGVILCISDIYGRKKHGYQTPPSHTRITVEIILVSPLASIGILLLTLPFFSVSPTSFNIAYWVIYTLMFITAVFLFVKGIYGRKTDGERVLPSRKQRVVRLTLGGFLALPLVLATVITVYNEREAAYIASYYDRRPPTPTYEEAPEIYGNKAGNIVNGGYFAQSGEWIYFSNSADDWKLYKAKSDWSEIVKLDDKSTGRSPYINVVGDWVYYNGRYSESHNGHALYKIRTDGTEKTVLDDTQVANIFVVGDWIYYGSYAHGYSRPYKIRTDGTKKRMILGYSQVTKPISTVIGDWIYFYDMANNWRIYKMRTNGTELTRINDDISKNVHVHGEWIYYTDANVHNNSSIYRIRHDSSGREQLFAGNCPGLIIDDGWIYYIDGSDTHNWRLWKMLLNGSEKSQLGDFSVVGGIYILEDWIYFSDYYYVDDPVYESYRVRKDGTGLERLF